MKNFLVDLGGKTSTEMTQESLTEFLKENLLVGVPARVTNVSKYESDQVVDVKAIINDIYEDGDIVKSPNLRSIFVKIPSGGGFAFKLPIAVGDLVTLHYSHKDFSEWLDGKGEDLDSPVGHIADLRDCWVTHGFGTRSSNQSPSQTDLIISGANTTFTITPEGVMSVVTTGAASLKAASYLIDAPVTITKTLEVQGALDAKDTLAVAGIVTAASTVVVQGSSLTVAGQEVSTAGHLHGGVTRGNENTDPA